MALTKKQIDIKRRIVKYGKENNYSSEDIQLAVNIAFIESSLGERIKNPDSTATGLYQYLQTTSGNRWNERHSNLDINNVDDQIKAFYSDLSNFSNRYNNLSDEVRGDLSRAEYVYVKHHDGSNYEEIQTAPGRTIYNYLLSPTILSLGLNKKDCGLMV